MELRGRLDHLARRVVGWAFARPTVLVADSPGTTVLRWQLEAELDRRRWPIARSPADADLLLVLGEPGPNLQAALDVVWSQVPAPRQRWDIQPGADISTALDRSHAALLDMARQPEPRTDDPGEFLPQNRSHDEHHHDDDHDDGGNDGDHDDGGDGHHHDQQGHEHGGHDAAGLPMAGTAPDRDGLELDSLHVRLGPVLPSWPTGLVIEGRMQGDVLTGVHASWIDRPAPRRPGDPGDPDDPGGLSGLRDAGGASGLRDAGGASGLSDPAGVSGLSDPGGVSGLGAWSDLSAEDVTLLDWLDRLARFLDVAGWPAAATRTRRVRHDVLRGGTVNDARADGSARRTVRRIRRSATLRWSVGGIDAVLDRVHQWCDHVLDGVANSRGTTGSEGDAAGPPGGAAGSPRTWTDVEALVDGQDLAAIRLIVASLEIDTDGGSGASTQPTPSTAGQTQMGGADE
ncbi:hypothetical protein [Phytoactinopolyspora halotolerans]|uniref:Uncharacterized protein n=1 Tax=Phytoactinopolyspora halotolerans TaxID=1981512 RepID=A0A6L9SDE2_9ACTN|nr:hypothetical protein [Phytoactinopolyspora halotolerans]NEE02040.1 hypothetical protein [Phytoactinopolyspora halotolerans]